MILRSFEVLIWTAFELLPTQSRDKSFLCDIKQFWSPNLNWLWISVDPAKEKNHHFMWYVVSSSFEVLIWIAFQFPWIWPSLHISAMLSWTSLGIHNTLVLFSEGEIITLWYLAVLKSWFELPVNSCGKARCYLLLDDTCAARFLMNLMPILCKLCDAKKQKLKNVLSTACNELYANIVQILESNFFQHWNSIFERHALKITTWPLLYS